MIKAYTAGAMTGLTGRELVQRSRQVSKILGTYGIQVLDPVIAEGVKPTNKVTAATYGQMVRFWKRDKEMIREAHVVIDLTPERKSEGVAHELGYARYFLFKPVVRVYLNGSRPSISSVAYFEDDLLVDSLEEAAIKINERWGTWRKRFWWRLALYNRCYISALKYKLGEWK